MKAGVTNLLSTKVEKDIFYPFVSTKAQLLGTTFLLEFELKFLKMNASLYSLLGTFEGVFKH